MNLMLLLPLFIGLTVVVQGTVNRPISESWGLSWTVFLNAIVFLVVSVVLLLTTRYTPQVLPEYLRADYLSLDKFKSWFLIPGLCGFVIVAGVPWSLQLNGASKTFILLIVSQIILGLLADKFLFHSQLSNAKLAGAALVMIGATLVAMSPK